MTFLGARELKPSRCLRGKELINDRHYREFITAQPLEAIHPSLGYGMTLKLKGEHLHGAYNMQYLLRRLKALVPDHLNGGMKTLKITFSESDLPYAEEELEALRNPENRIGFLGLHRESDYVPAPRRTFSSFHQRCGWIDIGRYGPYTQAGRPALASYKSPFPPSKRVSNIVISMLF